MMGATPASRKATLDEPSWPPSVTWLQIGRNLWPGSSGPLPRPPGRSET